MPPTREEIMYRKVDIDFDIDTFVYCNFVATRWQQYSTDLHTNSTQNNSINFWKSVGRAPSLPIIPWHLPYS
jgi:hypothetical protein